MAAKGEPFAGDDTYVVYLNVLREKGRRDRWQVLAFYRAHRADTKAGGKFSEKRDAVECAEALWNDYLEGVHKAPEKTPETVKELIDRFCDRTVAATGRELSAATGKAYRSHLSALVRITGEDRAITTLAARHFEAALEAAPSPRTRASYLRSMRSLCRWAESKGWLPLDLTKNLRVDPGPQQMRPWLQPEEVPKLLEHLPPSARIRCGLILETGLRASEAANLRWEWVIYGIGRPSIRIPAEDKKHNWKSKGRKTRAIPLSAAAERCLEEAAKKWGREGYVLTDRPKPVRTNRWREALASACAEAKITRVDVHGLRRTAGVRWLAAGLDIWAVSRLLGHSSVLVTEKSYAGLADSRLGALMDQVDAAAELPRIGRPGLRRVQQEST